MGCSSSSPVHPAIYNETLKKEGKSNGEIKDKRAMKEVNHKNMRGDFSQYQLARHKREKNHKERQIKIFMAADEMSEKALEDREMLLLGTRSRGTSRNTSRAATPTGNKRNLQQQKDDQVTPMTPVVEDRLSRGAPLRNADADTTPKKKHKKHKHSKTKGKTKKHKKDKKSKKAKGKAVKDIHESDNEDLDSGLEDEDDDDGNPVADSDKENEEIKAVMAANIGKERHTHELNTKDTRTDQNVNVIPLKDASSVLFDGTKLISNISIKDIKIQSASKDSGIAESGITDLPGQINGESSLKTEKQTDNTASDINEDEQLEGKSDSLVW